MTLKQAVDLLYYLTEDEEVPKKVRVKLATTAKDLENCTGSQSLVIAKALEQLETISENINIQPFIRTEIFNLVSMLEIAQKL